MRGWVPSLLPSYDHSGGEEAAGLQTQVAALEKGERKSQEVSKITPEGTSRRSIHTMIVKDNKLIPDSPAEQALMYQRMMEDLAFTDKLIEIHTHAYGHTT